MTDRALVLAKLAALRDHVDRMERRHGPSLEAFQNDIDRQDALALSLMVALQEAADIALHMASDEGWELASSYTASFDVLARHAVITPELAQRMAGVATLRNRVAHGYGTVDFARIWRETPDGITALREYAAAIARVLGPVSGAANP
jgi:uncharacterized protein YutE (UPF0331/DUF86 family)